MTIYKRKACGDRVAVKHLHGLERVLQQILAQQVELLEQVVGHRDDVTPDLVGLHDVQDLPRRGPDQLRPSARRAMISTARPMIGIGSMPASAIRPANTEM